MKLTLYMAISIDGFIARDDDSTPWSETEWTAYAEFVKSKGNLIVGRRTYEMMKAAGEFERISRPFTVVLSESRSGSPDGKTMFAKTPDEAMAVLKGQGFTAAVLGGGTAANTVFLQAGLIDEIILDVEAVFFGSGKRLFDVAVPMPKLRLIENKTLGETVARIHYRVTGA
ncbi:MAG: dihydrofolate reductase family protein [Patescibacteria group bacterium]